MKNNHKLFHGNLEIEQEIEEKGFSVYSYISLKELLSTVKKDYLSVLIKFNLAIPVVGLLIYYVFIESESFLFIFFGYFTLIYGVIFGYLFIKLISRTYAYFLISDVIFTRKGAMVGRNFVRNNKPLSSDREVQKYAEIFNEYLTRPSTLNQVIEKKRIKLISAVVDNFSLLRKSGGGGNDDFRAVVLGIILLLVHSVTMFIAYYIGVILGLILFVIYALMIKIILYLKDHIELKIKDLVTKIDKNLYKLTLIYKKIDNKITNFSAGNISNIDKFMEEKFDNFYLTINEILSQQRKLETTIEKSKYKEIIDFKIFKIYLKNQYNKPVNSMLSLLKKYEKNIETELINIEKTQKESVKAEKNSLKKLEVSYIRVKKMKQHIQKNIKNLSKFRRN